MYHFNFKRVDDVQGAVAAMASAEDGKFLAGGQTMLPTMKHRLASPSDLIDLNAIAALRGIEVGEDAVLIRAMTRHAEVAADQSLAGAIPALAHLASRIGDPAVRNRGTLGGSIANNDPAADYPAALLALGATVHTDRREIAAEDFFTGMFETALAEDELITAVRFPIPQQAAYRKFENPASRYALVGVFVARQDGQVRVAVTGAATCVYRATALEQALGEDFSAEALDGIELDSGNLNTDLHGSAQYRAHLVRVMAQRAVTACR